MTGTFIIGRPLPPFSPLGQQPARVRPPLTEGGHSSESGEVHPLSSQPAQMPLPSLSGAALRQTQWTDGGTQRAELGRWGTLAGGRSQLVGWDSCEATATTPSTHRGAAIPTRVSWPPGILPTAQGGHGRWGAGVGTGAGRLHSVEEVRQAG